MPALARGRSSTARGARLGDALSPGVCGGQAPKVSRATAAAWRRLTAQEETPKPVHRRSDF
jgi:hypothetical protein